MAGKGVNGKGDHIAELVVLMPQNLDPESVQLIEEYASLDIRQHRAFDQTAKFYNPQ